jgi:hypothetical protein
VRPTTPTDGQRGKLQRIVIQGNPNDEEQALILARVQAMQVSSELANLTSSVCASPSLPSPWTKAARSEQLNRWPQSTEDRYWHP